MESQTVGSQQEDFLRSSTSSARDKDHQDLHDFAHNAARTIEGDATMGQDATSSARHMIIRLATTHKHYDRMRQCSPGSGLGPSPTRPKDTVYLRVALDHSNSRGSHS